MQCKRKILGKINGLRNYGGSELGAYRISMVKLNHDGSEETKITHPGRWLNFDGSFDNGIDETIDYLLNARKDGWNIFAIENPHEFKGQIELILTKSEDGTTTRIDDDIIKAFERFRTIKVNSDPIEVTNFIYN